MKFECYDCKRLVTKEKTVVISVDGTAAYGQVILCNECYKRQR